MIRVVRYITYISLSSDYSLGLDDGEFQLIFTAETKDSCLPQLFRTVLGPTHPHTQGIPDVMLSGKGVNVTSHINLVPMLRMSGLLIPLPQITSCRVAK